MDSTSDIVKCTSDLNDSAAHSSLSLITCYTGQTRLAWPEFLYELTLAYTFHQRCSPNSVWWFEVTRTPHVLSLPLCPTLALHTLGPLPSVSTWQTSTHLNTQMFAILGCPLWPLLRHVFCFCPVLCWRHGLIICLAISLLRPLHHRNSTVLSSIIFSYT